MKARLLLSLVLIAIITVLPPASISATTSNLTLLRVAEDSFYNCVFP